MRRLSRIELAREREMQRARSRRDLAFFVLGGAMMGLLALFVFWAARGNAEQDWGICQAEARFHRIPIAKYCPQLAHQFWADVD